MINMTINNVNNTIYSILPYIELPWRLSGKESTFYAGDPSSIPAFGRSPEEGMTTHSSILAWRIPGTEASGRLQSMGSQGQT